jgi:plastocyanin
LWNEKLVVHPENKGIKNVVVHVYAGRRGSNLPQTPPRSATVTLANLDCRFEPHIVVTQTGDTLKVTNPDEIGHNANFDFFNNKQVNFTIPAGQQKSVELVESELRPIPVECNIHPWMKGYVLVLDHPFAAVSDDSGDLEIPGLPVGEPLVFSVFHEAGAIQSVVIGGEPVEWNRSRFEVDIQPGVNDLGTVVIPDNALSAK